MADDVVVRLPVREAALVRQAQLGDREAFAALVRRYQRVVHAVAYALTGRISTAEDVAQETFILTWRRLHEIREPDRFRSFLLGVARRKSLRALRERREAGGDSVSSAASTDLVSSDPSPLERAITHEQEQLLWEQLRRIPELYRLPLVLYYQEEKSTLKVADTLGLSEVTVRQRLSVGRRMLQRRAATMAESVLQRARPAPEFTAAVMLGLAALSTSTAKAHAGVGRAAAGGAGKFPMLLLASSVLILAVAAGRRPHALDGPPTDPLLAGALIGERNERRDKGVPRDFARWIQTELTTVPAQAAGTASDPSAETVLRLDFEDGLRQPLSGNGEIAAACPPRAGNQHCAAATLSMYNARDTGRPVNFSCVSFNDRTASAVHFSERLALSFDYWIAGDGWIEANTYRRGVDESKSSSMLRVQSAAHGVWSHLVLPFGRLRALDGTASRLEEGDALAGIAICTYASNGPLFLDNIEIGK